MNEFEKMYGKVTSNREVKRRKASQQTNEKRGNCIACHSRDVPIVRDTQLCIRCHQCQNGE